MDTLEVIMERYLATRPAFRPDAVLDLIGRVAGPECRERFIVREMQDGGRDAFILADRDGKIEIQANSGVAAASAFRSYLSECLGREYSLIGGGPFTLSAEEIKPVGRVIRHHSRFFYRYFLNFCTYGYTFAFWQFKDFEKLLDYMAMEGYNLALNILGHEVVVRRALEAIGYPAERISRYLSGPAFLPWQWMQNVSGHGCPLPARWDESRLALTAQFSKRAEELGIRLMLPGFGGMVPNDFPQVFPSSKPLIQGEWCGIVRPDVLPPDDPMFAPLAAAFYQATGEVFGRNVAFFSVDPFHEGGNAAGVDVADMARAVTGAMQRYNPRAVWVLQGWQDNPRRDMLAGIEPLQVLITDLLAEYRGKDFDFFGGYPWLYCSVNNFGAQRQLRGNVARSLEGPFKSLEIPEPSLCLGYGMMMEGFTADDVLYDIYGDAAFRETVSTLPEYIRDYAKRRYGITDAETARAAEQVWRTLAERVYITGADGLRESVFCARPGLHLTRASVYGSDKEVYPFEVLRKAVEELFVLFPKIEESSTQKGFMAYHFDLTDFTRQMLSNGAWKLYDRLMEAYDRRDIKTIREIRTAFFSLMSLTDTLCAGETEMRLDTWILKARELGGSFGVEDGMEDDARRIITMWGGSTGCELLHDYAQKEWAGLLSGLYWQRWERFFNVLECLDDVAVENLHFLDLEEAFVADRTLPMTEQQSELFGLVSKALEMVKDLKI